MTDNLIKTICLYPVHFTVVLQFLLKWPYVQYNPSGPTPLFILNNLIIIQIENTFVGDYQLNLLLPLTCNPLMCVFSFDRTRLLDTINV